MKKFTLPPLPYTYNSLEPRLDARTMELHHSRHHQSYVDKVNAAWEQLPPDELESSGLADKTIEEILTDLDAVPESIRTAFRNHGGGHANHCLFWTIMSPEGGGEPEGELAEAIDRELSDFRQFQEAFSSAAAGVFGSGWAWLVVDSGKLSITISSNQDTPLSSGQTPIFLLDVWEHAYYLKYQNRRPEYIEQFWKVVNWPEVSRRYREAVQR